MNTVCQGCTAIAFDHAIVCPLLGRMSNNRHKRVRAMSQDRLKEYLANKPTWNNGILYRDSIIWLRSEYFNNRSPALNRKYQLVKRNSSQVGVQFIGKANSSRRFARHSEGLDDNVEPALDTLLTNSIDSKANENNLV